MSDPVYSLREKTALWLVLAVAFMGLAYAALLARQVRGFDSGDGKMRAVAAAIRQGSDAYLARQLRVVAKVVLILALALYAAAQVGLAGASLSAPALGRSAAFLVGALFSGLVGFAGMRMATAGNLRVASAARRGFGEALQIGYRTGTVTGMLTDGLGLLGGVLIFMAYGNQAYQVLLGFGFGGTLLALFMRVGGGIYTKAADVGADLVGKIEKNVPEDDPRNAATIADNVGDNVGDCAGMAADVFESYEVTMVAAMILGWATFGHKGVVYPLVVRSIGVFASIVGTYLVRAGGKGGSAQAMKSINVGFWTSSLISVGGIVAVGWIYLRFPQGDLERLALERGAEAASFIREGLDPRPAWATLIGIVLAMALSWVTEHFTGKDGAAVRAISGACRSGHATGIIEGLATGAEAAVWTTTVLACAIFASAGVFAGAPPSFVAYGVAMCGIGMLTLTGNTISMDVFGPVADNANGIGEMAFDKKAMGEGPYAEARRVLGDLDAVGNTTKAITKGVAIGSAVIAALSLFASFVAVMAVGSEEAVGHVSESLFLSTAAGLSIALPKVFVGFLLGGCVPFLFSSLCIRAVGRAAGMIIQECRRQFRDVEIWEGRKTPDYGRVVSICTAAAQKELLGPGLLAVLAPVAVGFGLGPQALGGFLAGSILSGVLMAVFMAAAGGAWDNAKKLIEEGASGGKGSEAHKAAVTGDTVGDPLKDTAGPAINPLLKVMNMVSLLILPLVLRFSVDHGGSEGQFGLALALLGLGGVIWALRRSKRDPLAWENLSEKA